MSDALADTHSILWSLFEPKKLTPPALAALHAATHTGKLFISAVTLVEVNYLVGKKSFPYPAALQELFRLATDPNEPLEVLPLTIDIASAMDRVPRNEVPDMPDRIIAATAVAHRLPLVSADADIRSSAGLNALTAVVW